MLSVWTKHLKTNEEKEDFKKYLLGSKTIFNRILELVEEDIKSLNSSEIKADVYENANWAYKQAHLNGFRSCLQKYKTLFTLDQQENYK